MDVADVERIRIEMPGRWEAFRDAEMPALNLRFLMAIILLDGELDFVGAQSLERMHGDVAVRALMERVEVVQDPEQEHAPTIVARVRDLEAATEVSSLIGLISR